MRLCVVECDCAFLGVGWWCHAGVQHLLTDCLMQAVWDTHWTAEVLAAGAAVTAGVVSTALFNKGDFRYPFMVLTYMLQLINGQSPLQGAQSTIYAATGEASSNLFLQLMGCYS